MSFVRAESNHSAQYCCELTISLDAKIGAHTDAILDKYGLGI